LGKGEREAVRRDGGVEAVGLLGEVDVGVGVNVCARDGGVGELGGREVGYTPLGESKGIRGSGGGRENREDGAHSCCQPLVTNAQVNTN